MLAPLAESAITEPGVVRMGQHGLKRWPELIAQLDAPVFLQQNGTLVVWHRQDAPDASRLFGLLEKNRRINPSLPALESVSHAQMATASPHCRAASSRACTCPAKASWTTASCWPRWNHPGPPGRAIALAHRPRNHGLCPGDAGQPDLVLDCRGLGARTEWSALRGIRGEVVRVHAPEVTLQRPTRLMHPRYPSTSRPRKTICS
jgi:glycine oxidase